MNYVLVTGCDKHKTRTESVCSVGLILKAFGLNLTFLHVDSTKVNFNEQTKCILADGTQCLSNLGVIERFLDIELSSENLISRNKKLKFGLYSDDDFNNQMGNLQCLNVKDKIMLIDANGEWQNIVSSIGRANLLWVHAVDASSPKQNAGNDVTPDLIVAKYPKNSVQSLNNPPCCVVSYSDETNKYQLPLVLVQQKVDSFLQQNMRIEGHLSKLPETYWEYSNFTTQGGIPIAVVCDLTDISLFESFDHAACQIGHKITIKKIKASDLDDSKSGLFDAAWSVLTSCRGIAVGGGGGKAGAEGRAVAAEYARTNNVPFLGICYGMQYCAIEFARNVCGMVVANTSEVEPETPHPIFIRTKGTDNHGNQKVVVTTSQMREIFGGDLVCERSFNSYVFNGDYMKTLEQFGMSFVGFSAERGNVEIINLPYHPFFVGTQFHPEYNSRFGAASRIYTQFLRAAINK